MDVIIASIASFIGTNIDDIFLDTIFFAQADTKQKIRQIVLGKYLGIGILVLVSVLGAFVLQAVPEQYVRFLGVIPIILGIKAWIGYVKEKEMQDGEEKVSESAKGLMLEVALVTISGGADNIGIYVPLFAGYTGEQILTVGIVFGVMIALWCMLGKKLADLPGIRQFLLRYKHIIVPVVFITLGIFVLVG